VRYDYRCTSKDCGNTVEKNLSMRSSAAPLKCPACGKRTLRRQITVRPDQIDVHTLTYKNRFPYVSNALPFKGDPCGGKHHGPMGKIVVESSRHEANLRARHGYVGEKKVG
jgi:putative FmdB family regulatory protein